MDELKDGCWSCSRYRSVLHECEILRDEAKEDYIGAHRRSFKWPDDICDKYEKREAEG